MNNRDKPRGEITYGFAAHKQAPSERDLIALAELQPDQKRKLWNNIKQQNPAKAQAMKEAMQTIGATFPGSDLVMTRKQIRKYRK